MNSANSRKHIKEFGALLKYYRQHTLDPKKGGSLTQARLAELADCGILETTIGHWETGKRAIRRRDRFILCSLIRVLHQYEYNGLHTLNEANQFLEIGLYSRLTSKEIQGINPNWAAERGENDHPPLSQSPITITLSLKTITESVDTFFHWSEADDHARSSWTGMFIWCLSSTTDKLNPHNSFNFLAFFIIWFTASWLVTPILQWPLDSSVERVRASILFAFASVVIPFIIALLSGSDIPDNQLENTTHQKRIHFLLKLTGAVVGFNLVTILLLFLAVGIFYLDHSLSSWVWWLAMLLPLLMGYVGARRIPADRYKMYGSNLQLHPADPLFLIVFLLIGSVISLYVYIGYALLINKAVGISFLLGMAGLALWHRQKQFPIPDILLIFIVGTLIPFLILGLLLFVSPPSQYAPEMMASTGFLENMLVIVYIVSVVTIWSTLHLRNPPIITLQGSIGLLGILLFLLAVFRIDLFWGRLATLLTVALWIIWGNKRFRSYLKIHASVGVLIVAFGLSLFLAIQGEVSVWINLIGYTLISTGLIAWAYFADPEN